MATIMASMSLLLLFGSAIGNTTDAHVLEVLDADLQNIYYSNRPTDFSRYYDDAEIEHTNATENESEYYTHFTNDSLAELNETIAAEEYLNDLKDFLFPKTWTWVLISLHFVVFTVGLVGNILVCVAVYRNHSMRTVTNYFIVNLAIADFMVIVFCLIPSVIWDVTLTWFFGIIMCKVVLYLQTVSVTVSVLTLTFISVDRWYAICFPLKFKSTTGRAKTAIGIIWMIALTFDIPELVVYTTRSHAHSVKVDTIYLTQCAPTWSLDTDTFWTVLKLLLLYVVPLAFMTVTYYQITKVLWKSGSVSYTAGDGGGSGCGGGRSSQFSMNTNIEIQLRSRIKAAKMLVAVVLMFAFCYFPVHLLSVLRLTVGLKNTDFNIAFALISHWLCYANSAVNPVIYNFMSGKFRKEFRRAIDCCSQPYHPSGRHEMTSFFYKNTLRETMTTPSTTAGTRSTRRIVDRSSANNIDTTDFNSARRGTSTTVIKIDV